MPWDTGYQTANTTPLGEIKTWSSGPGFFIGSGHTIARWKKVSGFILQDLQGMIIFK